MLAAIREFDFRKGNPGIALARKVNTASTDRQFPESQGYLLLDFEGSPVIIVRVGKIVC